MHDVHNLAWKIASVVHGHGGEKLLDSYAAEREPVGRRNAEETGLAWSRIFNGDGGAVQRAHAGPDRHGLPVPIAGHRQ